jgi:SAM-dependent methyltransferase
VLHAREGTLGATIVADLSVADSIPSDTFDCIILTQTLQFIYDVQPAVRHLHRILKAKGVLLATLPGISQISEYDDSRWGDYWRFTRSSVVRLFESAFAPDELQIRTYGNALVASAFLHGLAVEELRKDELDLNDVQYQVLITVRGAKK